MKRIYVWGVEQKEGKYAGRLLGNDIHIWRQFKIWSLDVLNWEEGL